MGGATTGQAKIVGSASAYAKYLDDAGISFEPESSAHRYGSYLATPSDAVMFAHVRGKAAEHLPGLDAAQGLTKDQHARLHDRQWDKDNHVPPGHRPVWEKDSRGRVVKLENPETGRFEPIPVMDPDTGRQKQETVSVAGYDCTFGFAKSISEHLLLHPEDLELFRSLMLQATDTAMRVAVEDYAKITTRTVSDKRTRSQGSASEKVRADGLIWFSEVQFGARPTPESEARGYGADPHGHVHVFLSSMAWIDERWKAVDGKELFKTAAFRGDVASAEMARLLEEHGFELEYTKPDRKGRRSWELKGSNQKIRKFLSTNDDRAWKLKMKMEAEKGREIERKELQAEMQRTKGRKTKGAKIADEGGKAYFAKVKTAVEREGLEFTLAERTRGVSRDTVRAFSDHLDNKAEFFKRMEAPDGVARDCDIEAVFGPEAIQPAAFRAAMGLGFSADEIVELAAEYRDHQLVLVRDAIDPEARLYTTETILATEGRIAEAWERKAAVRAEAVPEEIIQAVLAEQPHAFDEWQLDALREICSDKRVVHIEAPAGSGKNDLVKAGIECLRRAGLVSDVAATSVAAKRGKGTGESVDADLYGSIRTLTNKRSRYLVDPETGQPRVSEKTGRPIKQRNRWVPSIRSAAILDEAATTNTFDMDEFLTAVGPAKVITIGDRKQNPAIGVAGHYEKELESRPPSVLVNVYRQVDEADRDALGMIREGKAHAAIADLAERGRIHVAETAADLATVVSDRYRLHRESGRTSAEVRIINQGSNVQLDAYNRFAQRYRIEAEEIEVDRRFKVLESSTGRRFTLFEGDEIIFNRFYDLGQRLEPIRNGSTGTILSMESDGRCRIRLDGPERRTVVIYLKDEEEIQPVAPAYCQATAKFQGDAVKVDITVPGSPEIASLNSGYSQGSRSIEYLDVCLDRERWGENPCRTLGVAWSTPVEKQPAGQYLASLRDDLDIGQPNAEWTITEDGAGMIYAAPSWEEPEMSAPSARKEALSEIGRLRQSLVQDDLDQSLGRHIGIGR